MKTIYYLGAYRSEHISERNPQGSSAEDYKMGYIIATLKKMGYNVVVISVLASLKHGYHSRKICEIDNQETHVYLGSYDTNRHGFCSVAAVLRLIGLFNYLTVYLHKGDTLLVYNTQLFSVPVKFAKRLRRFRLILEIEEIFYKEARTAKDIDREPMEKVLISAADGYLSINERVKAEYCDPKPTVISYGSYATPPQYSQRFNDGRKHIVYAGIINATHGSHQAIELMQYLDDSYFLHIYGFGREMDITLLNKKIDAMNTRFGNQCICFHGSKSGPEFDECLQKCHIGLNFNILLHSDSGAYAFPSKIPSYLCHGLNVLTYRIPSVAQSKFSSYVRFFDSADPSDIAAAVRAADINDYSTQVRVMSDFDNTFTSELKELLECH